MNFSYFLVNFLDPSRSFLTCIQLLCRKGNYCILIKCNLVKALSLLKYVKRTLTLHICVCLERWGHCYVLDTLGQGWQHAEPFTTPSTSSLCWYLYVFLLASSSALPQTYRSCLNCFEQFVTGSPLRLLTYI